MDADIIGRIAESAPNGVILVDREARIAFANREAERLFGHRREELIGKSVDILVPERLRQGHEGFRAAYVADPTARPMSAGRELFGLHKNGSEIPIEIGLSPIETDQGIFIVASIVDISARRRAEQRFRVAVEGSPAGMLMADPAGRIVLVNREIERLFHYRREDLLGKPVEVLVPIDARERHPELRTGFHRNPLSRRMGAGRDLFGRRSDGTQIPVEIALNPIETDEGVFVLASVIDISPRKKAEEELRRSNEELERFAYVASHDLQEPLRTVASYVQLLARRYRNQLDSEAIEFIDFAVAGASHMQRLIHDLLAFSRVGTRRREPMPVDVLVPLSAALHGLAAAIAESKAVITYDEMPQVLADEGQIEHLLANLLGNAIKFRGEEPLRVHIGVRRCGAFWEFEVADNGIGIEPKYFEKIFTIFQRLHPRERYDGTGMGLAICRKIVESLGGRIWVQSEPGKGSTFYYTLPGVPE